MYFKMTVYGADNKPTLVVTTDSYNLSEMITNLNNRYDWVWESTWTNEFNFESVVGTQYQFDNGVTGRVTIEAVERVE